MTVMGDVIFNFDKGDKADPSSLRENLEKRHIAYEERKEGNVTVISIKATEPKTATKTKDQQ